ncbi:hypothetical protein F511_08461 [Dorcoceras hygrometricum]|uniref:Fungal-type protein kinase domain-containing protein n=1 Tax=Dorcoceras hygrometricum TaxID=472368 RepID=A0A2Z7ABQ1_9LAMI|nr:hypothetical protein F511_08461 [Dorcoceras hygrometricum]
MDEISTLDFALEGVLFQQLSRMPCAHYSSNNLKEDEYLALEDFLLTAANGLWHAFWHKGKPLPYFVSCPYGRGSKFYTVEKAISRGRLNRLCGAALMINNNGNLYAHWDNVVNLVLFKQDITNGKDFGFSHSVICEALFYAVRILLSRSLSKSNTVKSNNVFVSVLDSKYGGIVKLSGDLGKLEIDLNSSYQSIADWIMCHAEVSISPVDRIWNKLGNVNWVDLGTMQLLLAIFNSIIQWNGPPRKSMASISGNHSLRLEKRRVESRIVESENPPVPCHNYNNHDVEMTEVEHENNQNLASRGSRLKLSQSDIVLLEDYDQGLQSFQIQEVREDGNGLFYIVVSDDYPSHLLNLYTGVHTFRLEPSWQDMKLWYQVQRQTKVLKIFKEQGISSKHLPEIIATGRIVHSGLCEKQYSKGRCHNTWCGTPMLVMCPAGEPVSSIVAHNGPFSAEETVRCCRDCLAALRSARIANIMHGDICPENILCVHDYQDSRKQSLFVTVSWGRAVLEDKDSPSLNLHFSSSHALQHGKLCPSSDVESLVYLIYFISGGAMPHQYSIESALKWRQKCWSKRIFQQILGEVSPLLKAFTDYVDNLCGTPYKVDYDVWLKKLNRVVDSSVEKGKRVEKVLRLKDVAESSGTSGGGNSL